MSSVNRREKINKEELEWIEGAGEPHPSSSGKSLVTPSKASLLGAIKHLSQS
jgi:hypothetical protein